MHRADGILFQSLEQVARIVVPPGHCIVIVHRGDGAWVGPRIDPGTYEIDIASIRPGHTAAEVFPMLVFVVPDAHSFAWASLNLAAADAMIDEAEKPSRMH